MVLPKEHQSAYTSISKDEVMDLAVIVKRYLAKIKKILRMTRRST